MATGLDWFAARDLARTGKAIRRAGWSRWLVRGPALWYSVTFDTDGTPLVYMLAAGEFTSSEFMATDWTDTQFDDNAPPTGTVLPPITQGSRTFGTDDNPPGPTSVFHLTGSVADENPRPHFTHTAPAGQVPVVYADVVRYDFVNQETTVFVRLAIMGGPPGVGTFSVQLDTQTPVTGTAWPGFDYIIEFPGFVVVPGATLTVTATYTNTVSTYSVTTLLGVSDDPFISLAAVPMPPALTSEKFPSLA